jgi:signal transduction histidine kinase
MADSDAPDLSEVLGELDAGWWRADLRGTSVNSSPNVPVLLGFPAGHRLVVDDLRTHRPWPGGVWRTHESVYASSDGVLRSHLVAVRDERGELVAVFGLETLDHVGELVAPVVDGASSSTDVDADAQLLHDILAIQPAMVVRYRADGLVEWCNEAYAAHFLREPAEVMGLSWVDLGVDYGHDTRDGLEATLAMVVEHTTALPATVVAPLVGSVATRWFQWTNRRLPSRPDGTVLFQGIGVEVTELRAARDALDAMAHELARGRLAERRELARRLHDDAIQVLVSAMWAVAPSEGRDVQANDAARGVELIREAIDHLRACLGDLTSPPVLAGLLIDHIAADVAAVRAAGAEIHLAVDDVPHEEIRTVAARVITEGLRNVVRHADASRVDVRLEVQGEMVFGMVQDDGVGADVDDVSRALVAGHVGLLMSRALVESIGGSFSLARQRPRGTVLEFRLPIHHSNG